MIVAQELEREGFTPKIVAAENRDQFTSALENEKFDLILSDYVLPGYSGGDAMELAHKTAPDTPFVFVSGRLPESIAIEKLKRGAADYVFKSHMERLGPAVRRMLQISSESLRRRLAEEELATAAALAGFGVFDHDLVADVYTWSPELKGMFGLKPDAEITSERIAGLIDPEDARDVQKAWKGARDPDGGGFIAHEHRIITPEGVRRWILVKGQIIFDGSGDARKPARALGVMVDISDRKRAESQLLENYDEVARAQSALRESEERLEAVVENLTEGLVIADMQGQILHWNRAALVMHGYKTVSEARRRLAEFSDTFEVSTLDGHVLPIEEWPLSRILRGETVHNMEARWRRKDSGVERIVAYGGTIVRSAGNSKFAFVTVTDITERKEAEEALREGDRRKDEFLAMLGHELRNPLSAIRNATTILKEGPLDAVSIKWAHSILERQGANLSRMVDDLLDVARITRGQIELRKEPISLGRVARAATDSMAPAMRTKRHHLVLNVPMDGGPWITGDSTRMEQVATNLLSNAVKYTPEGGTITITARRDGNEAVLSVRDTGIGMSSELIPRVFELFSQGNQSLDRAEGGLGIGLNLCRHLVALHGGRIIARSDGLGHGSEFTARFLARMAPGQIQPTDAIEPPAKPDTETAGGGVRVLIVDDNADTTQSLARILTRRGYETFTALDGPAGERVALEKSPQICLLDIGLPGFDGYELARRLRAAGPCMDALMIAISGYAQAGDRNRSRVSGFDAHLAKPVELEKLLELMAEVPRQSLE